MINKEKRVPNESELQCPQHRSVTEKVLVDEAHHPADAIPRGGPDPHHLIGLRGENRLDGNLNQIHVRSEMIQEINLQQVVAKTIVTREDHLPETGTEETIAKVPSHLQGWTVHESPAKTLRAERVSRIEMKTLGSEMERNKNRIGK